MGEKIEIPKTPERNQGTSQNSDHEIDLHFSPIISLPEVPVFTNEENEDIILKTRAKLYRFYGKDDPPEWKERGTGELKILRHKENGSFRIVMRRDKTFKVCANHFITPWMELKKSTTNEKAFIYTVMADFAEERSQSECLALKFATEDNARLFKTKFEDAQKNLLIECDLYNGKIDEEIRKELEQVLEDADKNNENVANEISEQLSTLKVTNTEDEIVSKNQEDETVSKNQE